MGSSDVIVHSLRNLPETEAIALLQHVRTHDRLDDLALTIARRGSTGQDSSGHSLDSDLASPIRSPAATFSQEGNKTPSRTRSPSMSAERGWSDVASQVQLRSAPESWFRTPQDLDFVEKLFEVYFAWHHPYHTTFSGPHFTHDYHKGNSRYCSSLLVYAVLSLACNYIDHTETALTQAQINVLGDSYFNEAQHLLNSSKDSSLITVQALTVMALREASSGYAKSSYKLLGIAVRMAVELNLHLQTRAEPERGLQQLDIETRKVTFWSLYNLEM